MKKDLKYFLIIISFIIYTALILIIFYDYALPNIIESRMKALDLMRYNSTENRFVGKDSVYLNSDDLYYIQYGKMK